MGNGKTSRTNQRKGYFGRNDESQIKISGLHSDHRVWVAQKDSRHVRHSWSGERLTNADTSSQRRDK